MSPPPSPLPISQKAALSPSPDCLQRMPSDENPLWIHSSSFSRNAHTQTGSLSRNYFSVVSAPNDFKVMKYEILETDYLSTRIRLCSNSLNPFVEVTMITVLGDFLLTSGQAPPTSGLLDPEMSYSTLVLGKYRDLTLYFISYYVGPYTDQFFKRYLFLNTQIPVFLGDSVTTYCFIPSHEMFRGIPTIFVFDTQSFLYEGIPTFIPSLTPTGPPIPHPISREADPISQLLIDVALSHGGALDHE